MLMVMSENAVQNISFFISLMQKKQYLKKDKTFKSVKHVSTETSVIFSSLMYKALEVELYSKQNNANYDKQ